jgi:hypothetical protein
MAKRSMAHRGVRPSVTGVPETIGDATEGSTGMSRFERTTYFERLVELNLVYAMRGDEDGTSVMTIDEAIAWAEAELSSSPTADS